MIEERTGDIFKQDDIDIIVHQANCLCAMHSGIAAAIRQFYPEAVEADNKTKKGDPNKLGTYSLAKGQDGKYIVNLYSQFSMGGGKRHTDYNAMVTGLEKLRHVISNSSNDYVIGIPYKIGSGLGGGDWKVVKAIIYSVFEDTDIKVVICARPEDL